MSKDYTIELVEGGVYGPFWHVISPNGLCLDVAWVSEDEARRVCAELNAALWRGRSEARPFREALLHITADHAWGALQCEACDPHRGLIRQLHLEEIGEDLKQVGREDKTAEVDVQNVYTMEEIDEIIEENLQVGYAGGYKIGFEAGQESQKVSAAMVDRFLTWPLPDSVCCDAVAMIPGHPLRTGTSLLTATEARAMLDHVIGIAK